MVIMGKQINLKDAKIISKYKDFNNPEQATAFYEKTRRQELGCRIFPISEYPENFREILIGLMKYQNPVQMSVWWDRSKVISDKSGNVSDENLCTTWDNFCTLRRPFILAEMFQAVEVLKRATPSELWDENDWEYCIDNDLIKFNLDYSLVSKEKIKNLNDKILIYFNEVAFPKIMSIVKHIEWVLDGMEEQIMEPIRAKINCDLKIMYQIPINSEHEFIKKKERRM